VQDAREDKKVDRRLRNALAFPDEATQRVLAGAFDRDASGQPAFGHRYAIVVVVAAALAAGVTVWTVRSAPRSEPFQIVGEGSRIVISGPDGRRWILDSQETPPTSGDFVIVIPK
jgi:hypothetical protein